MDYGAYMDFLFFGALLAAFVIYVAVTSGANLRAHLSLIWLVMAAHIVGLALYVAFNA